MSLNHTIKIGLTQKEIKKLSRKLNNSPEQVENTIKQILTFVMDKFLAEIRDWIKKYVPKQRYVRENILKNLESSFVKRGFMHVYLKCFIIEPEKDGKYWDKLIKFTEKRIQNYLENAKNKFLGDKNHLLKEAL